MKKGKTVFITIFIIVIVVAGIGIGRRFLGGKGEKLFSLMKMPYSDRRSENSASQNQQSTGNPAEERPFSSQKQSVISVTTELVTRKQIENYIKVNGDVVAETEISVYPDIAGKVSRIQVRVGDYVKKGQVVAMIDPSLPGSSYVESPVKAAISGTVTDVVAELGQSVTQSIPIVEIGSLDNLQVETFVPERFIGNIEIGKRAELSFDPYREKTFEARVVEMSPVLDAEARTLEITLSFVDKENLVKAGMFAEIKLITEVRKNAIAVPSECIVQRDSESVVFVLEENTEPAESDSNSEEMSHAEQASADSSAPFERSPQPHEHPTVTQRKVKTGISVDNVTEIIEGLEPGETVVSRGQTLLENGAQVQVVDTKAETGTGEGGAA
jgi:multidrug efflux pump subunit AcrA (membrane-fusion protein)